MVNGTALSTMGMCSLVLLLGCASAKVASPETPVAQPPTMPPPPPPARQAPAASAGVASNIAGPDALVALCETLREESPAEASGNAVEQAQAVAAHAAERQAALGGTYVTVVPASGFAFRGYQMGQHRLALDTERSFALGEAAELFAAAKDNPPTFSLAPDFAERLLGEHAAGRLSLRLVFRPAPSRLRKDGCLWLSGGHVVKMEIDLVAAALLAANGDVLTRADSGEYGDPDGGLPVRSPKVAVRKPHTADGRDVPEAVAKGLAALSGAAQPCYQRVLLVRPALRGTLVLAIRVGASGKVDEARVEMSSLGDDAVTACVSTAAGKTALAGVPAGRFSVPLHFASADEL